MKTLVGAAEPEPEYNWVGGVPYVVKRTSGTTVGLIYSTTTNSWPTTTVYGTSATNLWWATR